MAESLSTKRAELLQKYNTKATPTNFYTIPDRTGSIASRFPVQLGSYNGAEDQKWAMRESMINAQGEVPGVGQAIAPEGYFDYAQGKAEEMTMNDFYNWMMSQANLSTPESAQYWFGKYKWMKEMRESAAKKQHDLDWQLTEINLNGPQKEEDWLTLYMINQGLIQVPQRPTYQLYEDPGLVTNQYVAGLFSPMSQQRNFLPSLTPRTSGVVTWNNPMDLLTGTAHPDSNNAALRAGGNQAFQAIMRR